MSKKGLRVLFLFLYVAIYAIIIDATGYVYAAEIFLTHFSAMGTGMSVGIHSPSAILFTEIAPTVFGRNELEVLSFHFTFLPLACTPLVWKFCPEAKGLTLERDWSSPW